jgi:hypothetical protein
MPENISSIEELTRDYVEGVELAEAARAHRAIAPHADPGRTEWQRRWLELSEWARDRELRELEAELNRSLVERQQASDAAMVKSAEAMALTVYADGSFGQRIHELDPSGNGELAVEWANVVRLREDALRQLRVVQRTSTELLETTLAVQTALAKGYATRHHLREMRRLRSRCASLVFLLCVAMLFAVITYVR